MEYKEIKNRNVGARVTNEQKNEIDIIINLLNENREPNEPKYNYSYAFTFLIDYYKSNPNFILHIREQQLKKDIEQLNEQKDIIEFKLNKKENELKEIQSQLNNKSLDSYKPDTTSQQIILTKPLKNAFDTLINNCKQREIFNFDNIPDNMFFLIANIYKVDKHKLKEYARQNFNKEVVL